MLLKSAPFVTKMHDINSKYFIRQSETSLFSLQSSLQLLTVHDLNCMSTKKSVRQMTQFVTQRNKCTKG